MKKIILLFITILFFSLTGFSQETFYQYFDGADTSSWNSLIIKLDTSTENIWQIGPPQKDIFDTAATIPNVIVTDTFQYYPTDNISSFSYGLPEGIFYWGILALQWKQKLDMTPEHDGGIIEFWNFQAVEWQNVFNNPYVYAFYGFDPSNADTLLSGEYAFSGTDTNWRDIWLCFDATWLSYMDSLKFRYSFKSDTIPEDKEGWMMDNFMAHITIIHSVNEKEQEQYVDIWPNPSSARVNINLRKTDEFHIIEKMELYNITGSLMQTYEYIPTRFFIDVSNYPNGIYFLKVQSNIETEIVRIIVQH